MVAQIDHAAAVIEEQLSFTRDYEDLGTYTPSWQNVAAVAARAEGGAISETGISVSCDTGTLEIYADPMFQKVIENLFENAHRHGKRVTTVTVRFEHHPGGELSGGGRQRSGCAKGTQGEDLYAGGVWTKYRIWPLFK
ncbi:hypothetical protein [Methanogenium cariaci]|uniref:hypothetical protein n=1 Tax=Methanogenium cariaci TaxID=2197 RepID=UPI001C43BD8E|nr:hypothetical protein [Methanogenium cariaci]